jgi:hypothetical protein
MVWLLTVFAAIRHLRSQATTVSICRCRPSGEGHSSDVVRIGRVSSRYTLRYTFTISELYGIKASKHYAWPALGQG